MPRESCKKPAPRAFRCTRCQPQPRHRPRGRLAESERASALRALQRARSASVAFHSVPRSTLDSKVPERARPPTGALITCGVSPTSVREPFWSTDSSPTSDIEGRGRVVRGHLRRAAPPAVFGPPGSPAGRVVHRRVPRRRRGIATLRQEVTTNASNPRRRLAGAGYDFP